MIRIELLLPRPGQTCGARSWRVLDTRFDPLRLKKLTDAWCRDHPQGILHLTALVAPEQVTDAGHIRALMQGSVLAPLADQWLGLLPGFHRFSLAQGRLQFTLAIGARNTLLRELVFAADAIHLDGSDPTAEPWDTYALKALARSRRRGTRLSGPAADDALAPRLREIGFVGSDPDWVCDPAWELRGLAHHRQPVPVGRCAVVGAGLAGAAVASTLAQRGWAVDVFDLASEPAQGASGLPAGLLIPHVSSADGPRSRLTRAGLRRMRQEVEELLSRGVDWAPTGVLELRLDGSATLPTGWTSAGAELSTPYPWSINEPWQADRRDCPALWHHQAAWVKPAALVRAWLARAGVTFRGSTRIAALRWNDGLWELQDAAGQGLAKAHQVIIANAVDAPRLAATAGASLPPSHGMRGVLSWGIQSASCSTTWPVHPVSGSGSFIPHVPEGPDRLWFAGSTYEDVLHEPAPIREHLAADFQKLERLLPAVAQDLAGDWPGPSVRSWEAVRCVSNDRLPWVGALDEQKLPGLSICAAMGSRGLSLAQLCADLIAAQLGAEPLPVEASLARALDVKRKKRAP